MHRDQAPAPRAPAAALLATAATTPSPPAPSTPTDRRSRVTTSTARTTTTTTTTTTSPVALIKRSPPTHATTTTSPADADPEQARQACLALADVNHYRVVAANATWLRAQLQSLTTHHLLGSPAHRVLLLEEGQILDAIDAQYTIDRANCYLPPAVPPPGA